MEVCNESDKSELVLQIIASWSAIRCAYHMSQSSLFFYIEWNFSSTRLLIACIFGCVGKTSCLFSFYTSYLFNDRVRRIKWRLWPEKEHQRCWSWNQIVTRKTKSHHHFSWLHFLFSQIARYDINTIIRIAQFRLQISYI